MRRVRHFLPLVASCIAGCSGPQTPLSPAADQAGHVFGLFNLMLWVCGLFYAAVLVFLGVAIWRARRVQRAASHQTLKVGFGVWAVAITLGLIVLTTASFLVDRSLAQGRAHETLVVRVTAQQWWWRVQYRTPDGGWIETANELHLPAGATARIEVVAADVVHSFWIPNLAGKMDVIPGRTNIVDITPRRLGWVRGQCAEFCGLQHAHMALDVDVQTPTEFASWLARQAAPSAPSIVDPVLLRGQSVVTGDACGRCHTVRGTPAAGRPGPDLTHVGARRSVAAGTLPMSRAALQGWIAQPQALKPGAMMPAAPLSGPDANAVALYLESLR
jgi:cytochrome c oxidase subunit 2